MLNSTACEEDVTIINVDVDLGPFVEAALREGEATLTELEALDPSKVSGDVEGRPLAYPTPGARCTSNIPIPTREACQSSSTIHKKPLFSRNPNKKKIDAKMRKLRKLMSQRSPHLPPCYRPRLTTLRIISKICQTESQLDPRGLPVASGGWIGKLVKPLRNTPWSLEELKDAGFRVIEWDGRPHAILDKDRRVVTVLAGTPTAVDNWQDEIENQPGNLHLNAGERSLMDGLKALPGIRRIVGFQEACFALYAPKLYAQYRSILSRLYCQLPNLRPNFPDVSIFPAMTINLGPKTETLDHTDKGNVAWGWCAITALGRYDPALGGHIILFDLGLVITFPPGSTILIPSGIFRHGNTPIVGDNAFRMSLTQYCAGGLFRWVRYGFRTAKSLVEEEGLEAKAKIDGDLKSRVDEALGRFSTFDNLVNDRVSILRSSE